jgi:hypothetical protein
LTVAPSNVWPVVSTRRVEDWLKHTEESYRRQRRKRRPETFNGFLPPHSLFQKWKTRRRPPKRQKKEAESLTLTEWEQVWKPLHELLNDDGIDEQSLADLDWKSVKKEQPAVKLCFEQASELYNQLVVRNKASSTTGITNTTAVLPDDDNNLPTVFRVQEEVDSELSFYINASLGEVDGDFSMRLPPSLREMAPNTVKCGNDSLDYKPCLTKCIVQQCTYYHDSLVTKVLLEPRTGRRHQLRVHMALIQHAIVGDATYSSPTTTASSSTDTRAERMCLHSHKLSVDLPEGRLELQAPDPFRIESNKLIVDVF